MGGGAFRRGIIIDGEEKKTSVGPTVLQGNMSDNVISFPKII